MNALSVRRVVTERLEGADLSLPIVADANASAEAMPSGYLEVKWGSARQGWFATDLARNRELITFDVWTPGRSRDGLALAVSQQIADLFVKSRLAAPDGDRGYLEYESHVPAQVVGTDERGMYQETSNFIFLNFSPEA